MQWKLQSQVVLIYSSKNAGEMGFCKNKVQVSTVNATLSIQSVSDIQLNFV